MLRVGLLLNDNKIPAWAFEAIERIKTGNYAKIELIVFNLAKYHKKKDSLLYQLFRRIEKRVSKPTPDAFELKELKLDCPVIHASPIIQGSKDVFADVTVAEIAKYNLDVLIRFGFRILSGDILKAAKYGVWSYHHGDNREYRGMPAGFWEVIEKNPKTGAILQVLTEDLDGGTVIRRATFKTHPISPKRNANAVAWQAAHFLPEDLERLNSEKVLVFDKEPAPYSNRLYKCPTNKEMLSIFPNLIIRKVKDTFTKKPWQWKLALKFGPTPQFSVRDFTVLNPPNNYFWADPFVVYWQDQYLVFYEEYSVKDKRAWISCMVVAKDFQVKHPKVLDNGKHLSYPNVFQWRGEWFMIPESIQSGAIELYRAKNFPFDWVKERDLVKGHFADPTIIFDKYHWNLFATLARPGFAANSELRRWTSKDLASDFILADWQLANDVDNARGAGKFFEFDGKMYRPSQNCAFNYGGSVNLNRVDSFEPYHETKVAEIRPPQGYSGLHTFNFQNELTVIDLLS